MRRRGQGGVFGLIYIDLDDFKQVNDNSATTWATCTSSKRPAHEAPVAA